MSANRSVTKTFAGVGPVPMAVRVFMIGTAVMAALALTGFVLGTDWQLVKLGEENNIPTWFSSVQLFAIAVVLSPIVVRDAQRNRPRSWILGVVPGLFAFLSLDEVAMIHERIGAALKTDLGVGTGLRTGPWMLVFLPLVGVLVLISAVVFWPYLRGRRDVLVLAVAGLFLYGLAAAGFEGIANFVAEDSLVTKLLGFIEEIGEMLAANIIFWAALVVVGHEGVRLELGARRSKTIAV
ncbi:MAG: hypothetical protein GXP36_09540 [Actinobacteria bacterium]|nr:hypothetical protein [Actinomycetota bacterium]